MKIAIYKLDTQTFHMYSRLAGLKIHSQRVAAENKFSGKR